MRLNILPLIAAVMVLASAPEARANCSSPTDVESTLLYNNDYHVLQYCDNTNWIGAGAANSIPGLIGWWKLDESSGTLAADSSGKGHEAVLYNGPTWQSAGGQLAGALAFDATNDYADAGVLTALSGLNKATLSAWIYRASTSDSAAFGETGLSVGGNYRFDVIWDIDSTIYVEVANNSTSYPNFLKSQTGWHHIAVVYDGTQSSGLSRLTVYWDNVVQTLTPGQGAGGGSPAASLPSGGHQPVFYFGRDVGTGGIRYWGGRLDDVRVYSRALSAAEINDIYLNAGSQPCTSCSCTNPTGVQGAVVYNENHRTPQYCNGESWQKMGEVYTAWGVTFDGTNDYLLRGGTVGADNEEAIGSFWFRRNGGTGTTQVIYSNTNARFEISFNTSNKLRIFGARANGTTLLDITGSSQITDTNWHHALFSFDLAATAKRFIYIDGAAETLTVTTYSNSSIDFSAADNSVGATVAGGSKLNADLADFWLMMGVYLDISVAGNRRAFRGENGNAVDLGSDGGLPPTGWTPQVFLSDSTLSSWPTNKGFGGGFTVTGTLTEATTSPGRACQNSAVGALAGSYATPGSAYGVWGDGTYVYVADYSSGVEAFTFNGTSFTLAGSYATPGSAYGVWGDGTYIYVADYSSGVEAFTFNGTSFTLVGSTAAPSLAYGVWGDGTYIYVADYSSGVKAFTFNGTSFTLVGSYTLGFAEGVWGDGTYVYVADGTSGVEAFTFNGTSFTLKGSYATPGYAEGVWGDGTYVYVADYTSGVEAFTFNGTSFTLKGSYDTLGNAHDVWGDGTYVYVADDTSGVEAFTFNGTSFTLAGSYDTPGFAYGVWGDGTYVYVADYGSGVEAFSPTLCSCASPTAKEGTILYNGDYHVLQYCDGVNWRGIGK